MRNRGGGRREERNVEGEGTRVGGIRREEERGASAEGEGRGERSKGGHGLERGEEVRVGWDGRRRKGDARRREVRFNSLITWNRDHKFSSSAFTVVLFLIFLLLECLI